MGLIRERTIRGVLETPSVVDTVVPGIYTTDTYRNHDIVGFLRL